MSKHVILLTDAHEAPAYELIEALRAAGVKTFIEGLREVEVEVELARQRETQGSEETLGPPPLAVIYEVVPGADMVELHTAIDHAKAFWPGAPLIACRRHSNGYQSLNLRSLDGKSKTPWFSGYCRQSRPVAGPAQRNRRLRRNW